MPKTRIYLAPEKISDYIEISDKEIIHKVNNVLRVLAGEEIYVFDGVGREFIFTISKITKKLLILSNKKLSHQENLSAKKIILGFPLVKEERIDFILQKATELGVFSFQPFICERSINVKPGLVKIERWRKIVMEACRQSERLWLPEIKEVIDFAQVARLNYKIKLAGHISGEGLSGKFDSDEVFIVVGPEGDFSNQEIEALVQNNFKLIKFAPNILRVETAAAFFVGLVNYFLYDD